MNGFISRLIGKRDKGINLSGEVAQQLPANLMPGFRTINYSVYPLHTMKIEF